MRGRSFTLAICALAYLASSLGCLPGLGGLDFTVVFEDAKGLEPGDAVAYKGMRIGLVRAVELTLEREVRVSVRIDREFRETVYREARFVIERVRVRTRDPSEGERQVTMKDRGESRTPVLGGDVIQGSAGSLRDLWQSIEEAGGAALEAAEALAEDVFDSLESAADSPEAKRLREDLDRVTRETEDLSREEWERFRDERLPALEDEARRLRERLEQDGRVDQAREFWQDFLRWLKEILSRAPAEVGPTTR
jgi:hypothetical protein